MNSNIYTLAGCLLLPVALVIAAKQSYTHAATDEDRRYVTENWRTRINAVLHSATTVYIVTLFMMQLEYSRKDYDLFHAYRIITLFALVGLMDLIFCHRSMAKLKRSLMPVTEYSQYGHREKSISTMVLVIWLVSTMFVMVIYMNLAGSIDDTVLWVLGIIGILVAICGPLFVAVDRIATRLINRILPETEMEMLRCKLAKVDSMLKQHLPADHIPVKLEIMEFMIGSKESLLYVSVDTKSDQCVSVSLLGLKRLDENELLFLALSGAFSGVTYNSHQADQRALAITADRHTAISALKKELGTAFREVRYLQKRIKALEVI